MPCAGQAVSKPHKVCTTMTISTITETVQNCIEGLREVPYSRSQSWSVAGRIWHCSQSPCTFSLYHRMLKEALGDRGVFREGRKMAKESGILLPLSTTSYGFTWSLLAAIRWVVCPRSQFSLVNGGLHIGFLRMEKSPSWKWKSLFICPPPLLNLPK